MFQLKGGFSGLTLILTVCFDGCSMVFLPETKKEMTYVVNIWLSSYLLPFVNGNTDLLTV